MSSHSRPIWVWGVGWLMLSSQVALGVCIQVSGQLGPEADMNLNVGCIKYALLRKQSTRVAAWD